MSDNFLPEVDACLVAAVKEIGQIKKDWDNVPLRIKFLLTARYATAAIYPELMTFYQTQGDKWSRDAVASIFGYFARHNDVETLNLIEARLKEIKELPVSNFFGDLARVNFTEGMEKLLQDRFKNSDQYDAGGAAYFLSKYGGAENRQLLEKRYKLWLKQWQPLRDEFDKDDAGKTIQAERMFQVNLIQALKDAKNWKLSDTEINELKNSCFSKMCLRYFPQN